MNLARTAHLALLVAAFAAMLTFTIDRLSAQSDPLSSTGNAGAFLIQLGVAGYAVFAVGILAYALRIRSVRKEGLGTKS